MRKDFFNSEETGFFKTQKRDPVMKNPMTGNDTVTCKKVTMVISVLCDGNAKVGCVCD